MKNRLIRITTVPLSLEKLLEGQLTFMSDYYEVIALSSDQERLKDFGISNNVKTKYIPLTRKLTPFIDFYALIKLFFFLKSTKPLIVHSHTPKAGVVAMVASWLARVPIRIHTVAGLPLMVEKGFKFKLLKGVEIITYRCAHKVYPNSKGLLQYMLKERLLKESKTKVIASGSSNGINIDYFSNNISNSQMVQIREDLGMQESDFVYLFVGRLVGDKGINELVSAFCKIASVRNDVSLLLVGPFESDLDPLDRLTLDEIEGHNKIFTTGFVQDVRPYFSISHVLTFPSYREGFPNVVMQAGAMGLPSIVSNINGCNEIIVDGVNGLIVEPGNTDNLVQAMIKILEDSDLRKKLSESSRSLIVKRFDRMIFHNQLLQEYKALELDYEKRIQHN